MPPTILGLDIGGANLKAATPDRRAVSVPFALWKQPDKLPAALAELVARFPDAEELAVTMTGELCDCYETKREGVSAIVKAVRFASGGRRIRVWSTDGGFVNDNEAKQQPLKVASANWHALATLAGQYVPHGPATLLDMGSTTTDVIPLLDGVPISRGLTDPERLQHKELVYTGVRRTPVLALWGEKLAAELFATTLDVYLWLGMVADDESDVDTADGRAATRERARDRLARMFCGDRETVPAERIRNLAERVREQQLNLLVEAYDYTWLAIGVKLIEQHRKVESEPARRPIICGSGEFLLQYALTSGLIAGEDESIELNGKWGPQVSACGPAYAVAVLAAERR